MSYRWLNRVENLPIAAHLEAICSGVSEHSITLLEAPPGTGKTTVLPLALLEEPSLAGKTVLILQPRRIAAKSVAARMADLLDEPVGGTVGYSVRLESKRSKNTRVEVITEGLLTRRLIADPELSGVGAVIFDEFHERSLHADVSLALTLETLTVLRPDLKLIIMSATLGESLPAHYLQNAWRYGFEGRTFPVTITYEPGDARQPVWERVASAIKNAAPRHEGDILAFLPGSYEIQRTKEILERSLVNALVMPLFGDLPFNEQAAAIQPDPSGRRKIVLATTIAETSLTIEGVRIVVDSGTHKVSRANPSGFSSLSTEPISRDAADQRAGRAGRTAPGVCIRLWSPQEHQARRPYREPEVLRSDLCPSLLDLAAWGVHDIVAFPWITPPPVPALIAAQETLRLLGAAREDGSITTHGKAIASLGAHPRLGTLAVAAKEWGLEAVAAHLITLIEERDILGPQGETANVHTRLEFLTSPRRSHGAAHRLGELSARWANRIAALPAPRTTKSLRREDEDAVPFLLATAYPEQLGRRREDGSHRYLLASGKGATLKTGDPLRQSEYIVACSVQETGGELAIRLAAPFPPTLLEQELSRFVTSTREVRVSSETGTLTSFQVTKAGALTISSRVEPKASDDDIAEAFATWLQTDEGWSKVRFSDASLAFISRVRWARERQGDAQTLPDLSDEALRSSITDWLLPFLPQPPSLKSLTDHVVHKALESSVPWSLKKELDEIAPATITIPTGRARPLDYSAGSSPRFEARIQDLFGMANTPQIGRYRVPTTIHLLSPAHRPVQVTQDLANFWRVGYPEVRKELRGRYPKHKWPEDPLGGSIWLGERGKDR
jgi:ATP-dependent helicase HrpB